MIAIYRYEKINYELNRLRSALNEAQIPFIPLEGSVLRQYYPEPWMRTSSYWCMRAILNVILQHLSINWHIGRNQKVLMILVCFRTPVFRLNCTFAFLHFNEYFVFSPEPFMVRGYVLLLSPVQFFWIDPSKHTQNVQRVSMLSVSGRPLLSSSFF